MRPVSIPDFIAIIYTDDSHPPTPATIRRRCPQKDSQGRPEIPGAYKDGKAWKIDLDIYLPEMERRIRGVENDEDDPARDLTPEEMRLLDGIELSLAS